MIGGSDAELHSCQCGASRASLTGARPIKRRDFLRYAGAATAVASLGPLTACARTVTAASQTDKRIVVLGFDGMDWQLARKLMAQGRMPHFQRLAREGLAQPLGTSIPPLSPVAWSNFITGMDSSGHGIFDFIHRNPKTMEGFLSTSRTEDAGAGFNIGGWRIPLGGGKVTLLRKGEAFWEPLKDRGVNTTILRMPANFPPSGTADRELSGLGTPDVLGSQGTYSFYNSDTLFKQRRAFSGGQLYPFTYERNVASGDIPGPPNPFRNDSEDLTMPFQLFVDPVDPVALLRVGNEERVLRVGEWSDWVPIAFHMAPTQSLAGQVRFHLGSVRPDVELYASPVNFDPLAPGLPISTPEDYSRELAEATGRFYTQGMPEETEAVTDGMLTLDEFLEQARIAQRELDDQYEHVLGDFDTGLLFYYFGYTDQVAHILWRSMDPGHPKYDSEVDPKYADVIPKLYEQADRHVGRTMDRLGKDGTLLVMSDHGFASWRRAFNLNTWLEREGYLKLARKPERNGAPTLNRDTDWSHTRAYGLGINGLYINVAGRERDGIVPPGSKTALLRELADKLEHVVDPATGERVVRTLFISQDAFDEPGDPDIAPDAIVGYNKTYRSSSQSGLGRLEPNVVMDNVGRWSGDHSMDPATVPGVVFANKRLSRRVTSLQDLAAAILAEFGIDRFPTRNE